MYDPRFIQYLNLPKIPKEILKSIVIDVGIHKQHHNASLYDTYTWSDFGTQQLNDWGKANIGQDLYFGVQLMTGHVPIHTDIGTKIKINYIVETGGSDVETIFYDHDHSTKLESYKIEPGQWHVFKADSPHEVVNITNLRVSITARLF